MKDIERNWEALGETLEGLLRKGLGWIWDVTIDRNLEAIVREPRKILEETGGAGGCF